MVEKNGQPRSFNDWDQVYKNNWWTFWQSNGRHVLASSSGEGAVAVFVVDSGDHVLLNRQYRIALDRFCLEIPRGGIDPGETPVIAAQRELKEETGLNVPLDLFVKVGEFYPDSGIMAHIAHVFVVKLDTEFPELKSEDVEEVNDHQVLHLNSLRESIKNGIVMDAFSIIAKMMYQIHVENHGFSRGE